MSFSFANSKGPNRKVKKKKERKKLLYFSRIAHTRQPQILPSVNVKLKSSELEQRLMAQINKTITMQHWR